MDIHWLFDEQESNPYHRENFHSIPKNKHDGNHVIYWFDV